MLHGVFPSGGKEIISHEEINFLRRKGRDTQENALTLHVLPLGVRQAAFQGVDGGNLRNRKQVRMYKGIQRTLGMGDVN